MSSSSPSPPFQQDAAQAFCPSQHVENAYQDAPLSADREPKTTTLSSEELGVHSLSSTAIDTNALLLNSLSSSTVDAFPIIQSTAISSISCSKAHDSVPNPNDAPMQPPAACTSNLGDIPNSLSPGCVPVFKAHFISHDSQNLSSDYWKEDNRQPKDDIKIDMVRGCAAESIVEIDGHKINIIGDRKVPGVQEIQSMLSAQRNLMHQQIEELKRVFILQLNLTGVNPLSKEMTTTMLGTKAGRRPEDSITKEALRCLQDVFSIKDTITKKEACDISVRTGATRTQVRDFFAGQQSRVRKLMQQSNDEVGHVVNVLIEQPEPVAKKIISSQKDLENVLTADSCEQLLEQMRSESSFSGQAELLHAIMQTDQGSFLRLFLDKGGLRVLGRWLVKAAVEEQTTLLRLLLKALSHLPVNHAVPGQMSSIVQAVNKLRFYGTTDVASRARTLLAKWSKLFGRTVSGKSSGSAFEIVPSQKRPGAGDLEVSPGLVKRNREQVLGQIESSSEKKRVKMENVSQSDVTSDPTSPLQTSFDRGQTYAVSDVSKELLMSSAVPQISQEISAKINTGSIPQQLDTSTEPSRKRLVAAHGKERRKVLLVDELVGSSRRGKDIDVRRTVVVDKFSRPLSADDIQKAKMRARLLQNSNVRQNVTGSFDIQSRKPEDFKVVQAHGRGVRSAGPEGFSELNRSENFLISPDVFDIPSIEGFSDKVHQSLNETLHDTSSLTITKDVAQEEGIPVIRSCSTLKVSTDKAMSPESQHLAEKSMTNMLPTGCLGFQSSLLQEGAVGTLQDDSAMVMDCSMPKDIIDDAKEQDERLTGCNSQNGAPPFVGSGAKDFKFEVSKGVEEEISPQLNQVSEQSSARAKFLSGRTIWLPWSLPPEVDLDPRWSIAAGEDSKEKGIQFDRVSREEEAFYLDSECIPENPKAPWDEEPDYDDSLTLEVPSDASVTEESQHAGTSAVYNPVIDELPSMNMQEGSKPGCAEESLAVSTVCKNEVNPQVFSAVNLQSSKPNQVGASEVKSVNPQATSSILINSSSSLANSANLSTSRVGVTNSDLINHDPELLAFLLRNPEVLSKLTSQHTNIQDGPHLRIPSSSHESNPEAHKSGGTVATSAVNMSVTNVMTPSFLPRSTAGLQEITGFSEHTNVTIISMQSKAMPSETFQPRPVQAQHAPLPLPKLDRSSFQASPLITSGAAPMHMPFNPKRTISVDMSFQGVSEWKPAGINATMSPSTATLAQPSATPTTGLLRWPTSEHTPRSTCVLQSYTPGSSRQTQLSSSNPEDNAPALRQARYTGHAPPLPPDSRISGHRTGREEAPREGGTLMPHGAYMSTQEKFIGRSHLPNVGHSVHINGAQDKASPLFQHSTPPYFTGSGRPMGDKDFVRRPEHVEASTRLSNSPANVPVWMPNVGSSRPSLPSEVPFAPKQHPNIPRGADSFSRPILTTPIQNVILPREVPSHQIIWSNNPPRSTWRG